jgi:hypothetical protein
VLSALLAGSTAAVPYLPTNDGPEWVFATHVENHYGDPGTIYPDVFVPALQFASRGFAVVYGPLEDALGWQRGLEVALAVVTLVVAWGFVALVRAVDPARWAVGMLGFPLALSWTFYMGFWSFHVATGLGLFALALALRLREPSWKGRAAIGLLLFAVAVAHVFAAVLAGGAIVVLSVARAPSGRRLREASLVALTGLPAGAILVACVVASSRQGPGTLAAGFERFPWSDVLTMLPRTLLPGPLGRALVATCAAALAGGVAAARAFRAGTSDVDRGLGVAAVALLLAAVFAPFQIPGWQAFSERFVVLGAALALAAFPVEALAPRVRRAAPTVAFVLAGSSLALSYPFHRRLAALCPDAIAGLSAPLTIQGELLPITIRNTERPVYDRIRAEVPVLSPLVHMGTLYAAAHGGASGYYFGNGGGVYPFERRPGAPHAPVPDLERTMRSLASDRYHHDLAYRRDVDSELALYGTAFAELAVFGALPEDLALFRERGFVADWAQGSALLAHFEPCAVDLVGPASVRGRSAHVDISVGAKRAIVDRRPDARDGLDGLAHLAITGTPCGTLGVRARWDADASGPALTCQNAGDGGEVAARVTRRSSRVYCDAGPASPTR